MRGRRSELSCCLVPLPLLLAPLVLDDDETALTSSVLIFVLLCYGKAEEKERRAVEFYRGLSGGRDVVGRGG